MDERLKPYSFPMGNELRAALQTLADADHRPLANFIRLKLEEVVREARASQPELFEQPAEAVGVS
jgi:hypothetical protein